MRTVKLCKTLYIILLLAAFTFASPLANHLPTSTQETPVFTNLEAEPGKATTSPSLAVVSTTTSNSQFYVSPQGTANGDGSRDNPWDLLTVFRHPAAVKPGDTIWLRGGTYNLWSPNPNDPLVYVSNLEGAEGEPITVRAYPGERAIIDWDYAIILRGAWTNYWGLEFTCSSPKKVVAGGWSPGRPARLGAEGLNNKIINCIFHDLEGWGAGLQADNFEVYGSLFYYMGFIASERSWGNAGYHQNESSTKIVADNIMFQQFNHSLQVYGSDNAYLRDFRIEGNTMFNAGALGTNSGFNAVVGNGVHAAERISFLNNYTYSLSTQDAGTNVFLNGSSETLNKDLVVTGNYFAGGGPALRLGRWEPTTFTGNTIFSRNGLLWAISGVPNSQSSSLWNSNSYYDEGPNEEFRLRGEAHNFAAWQRTSRLDEDSRFTTGRPTGTRVFLRPNKYEPGRAHITVYNWNNANSLNIDIGASGLNFGQRYEVKDVQNYFGPPVATGTFNGSPVRVPLNLTEVTPINGAGHPGNESMRLPVHTAREFNVFVVVPR